MRFVFANATCLRHGVLELDDYRPADPRKPDRRAAAEMCAFDNLSAEARRAIATGPFGANVADLVDETTRRGAPNSVRERLKARGLFPCDVGTEGVVLERVAILEEAERDRIKGELAR